MWPVNEVSLPPPEQGHRGIVEPAAATHQARRACAPEQDTSGDHDLDEDDEQAESDHDAEIT